MSFRPPELAFNGTVFDEGHAHPPVFSLIVAGDLVWSGDADLVSEFAREAIEVIRDYGDPKNWAAGYSFRGDIPGNTRAQEFLKKWRINKEV